MSSINPSANTGAAVSMPPYGSPLVGPNGFMSMAWQTWFQTLFNRIGGLSAVPATTLPNDSSLIANQYIPTSQTTMYTSPGAISTVVDSFDIQNKSKTAVTVSCWIVPPGGSPLNSNIAISGVSIAENSIQGFPSQNGTIIPGGGMLVFQASAANALQPIILGRQSTV